MSWTIKHAQHTSECHFDHAPGCCGHLVREEPREAAWGRPTGDDVDIVEV